MKLSEVLGWAAIVAASLVAFHVGRTLPARRPGPAPRPAPPPPRPAPPPPPAARAVLGAALGETTDGLPVVRVVYPDTAAARAGLEAGDVLLELEGEPASLPRLLERLGSARPGDLLRLRVRRAGGEPRPVEVTLEGEGFELALAQRLIARAQEELLAARRPDGLWPHYQDTDAPSTAVSALVAWALARAGGDRTPAASQALDALRARLLASRGPDGGLLDPGHLVPHRVYGTALLLLALEDVEGAAGARAELAAWLAAAQVQEERGFDPIDPRYGGWSYYDRFEVRALRTDVSTARYALMALAAAGLADDHPAWARARLWLDITQNQTLVSRPGEPAEARERELRDGGFAFGPRMSKAGARLVGETVAVNRSYGSATADGLLGLLAIERLDRRAVAGAGRLELFHERIEAALRWLARHYSVGACPGFEDSALPWAAGLSFYYRAALAEALHRAGVWEIEGVDASRHAWAKELVRELAREHANTGRFHNPTGLMHEDEPALAASLALLALSAARDRLALGAGATLRAEAPPPALPQEPQAFAPPADAVGRGRAQFERLLCASCHRDDGAGNGPALVGVADRYLLRFHGEEAAAAHMRRFLRDPDRVPALATGTYPARMIPLTVEMLDEAALGDLVAFLLSRSGTRPVSGP